MSLDLRPLTLGELLDRSFSLYRHHFWLFVGLMALPSVFQLVLNVVVQLIPELAKSPALAAGEVDPMTIATGVITAGVAFVAMMAAYWVAYMVTLGATTVAVSELYVGRTATIASAYAGMRGQVGRLMLLLLLIGLRLLGILFGLIAIIVVFTLVAALAIGPFAVALAFMGTMLAVLSTMVFALRYAVSVPSLVLENVTASTAIRRSIVLTRDSLGRTAVLVVFAMMITYATMLILQGPLTIGALIAGPETRTAFWLNMAGAVTGTIGAAISGPLMIIALAILYYDLRIRKEGLDLQLMIAGLDGEAGAQMPVR